MPTLATTASLTALALVVVACGHSHPDAKTIPDVTATDSSTAVAATPADASTAATAVEGRGAHDAPIVGGYHPRAVTEPEIVEVAKKTVTLIGATEGDPSLALVSIETAASQVVAGMNFALDLKVQGKAGARTLAVVVYRDLQNAFSLTRVTAK
jgi:hypothetical protein